MREAMLFFNQRVTPVQELVELLGGNSQLAAQMVPPAEMSEDDTKVTLSFLLPAIDPANIDLQISDKEVILSGFRKAPESGHFLSEIYYGKFERRIPIRHPIDINSVKTTYVHGLLTLTADKMPLNRPKYVQVKIGQ